MFDYLISPNVNSDKGRGLDPGESLAKFERRAIFLPAQKSELEISGL